MPGASAVNPGPHGLPRVAGVRHRLVRCGPVDLHVAEAGDGPPLLMLHGEPQHWYAWRHVIGRIADRFHVFCPDLRGMGWSDAPATGYTKQQLSADVLALLDALDLDRVRLVGHDYGGIAGFLLCLDAPERVSRYLALNTYHPWTSPMAAMANVPRMWYQAVTGAPRLGPSVIEHVPGFWSFLMTLNVTRGTWADGEVEHYARHVADPHRAEATSQLARTLLTDERIYRDRYRSRRLTTPTRMILGGRDFAITPRLAAGWSGHANDMTVRVARNLSHWIPNQAPELVAEQIDTFLA